ncbi:MAG TPA: hypothetical protein VES20_18665 [Bryobacteraceae bacterium]|nr:hypothetical protein [Bryobacteraceae bacterium]
MRTILFTTILSGWIGGQLTAETPRFRPDDPIWQMPQPLPVSAARMRKIGDFYDVFYNELGKPGERQPRQGEPIRARGVNTLGEVPDGEWYVNRHYWRRLSPAELEQGPAGEPPSRADKWTVVAAKNEGVTPGFTITDATGRRFVLKFDPVNYPELATAADVISSRFFYALGYHVPANHIVYFKREDLVLGSDVGFFDRSGHKRRMTKQDLYDVLGTVHKNSDGQYRAVASLYLTGEPIGPRRWHGTRRDDPNDTVPHEHRRDLRGMKVFAAWLAHDDSRSINSLDMVVDDGVRHVRHYLIDFGSTLGSASYGPNSPRSGNVPFFSWPEAAKELFTVGLYLPKWSLAKYPKYPSVGRFEHARFNPERWVPEYRNPAFENMLPDDGFWAAKQVSAFTDADIRGIVRTGQLSDPNAEQWLVECLIQRRDKIVRAFVPKLLPLDRFRIEQGRLKFDTVGSLLMGSPRYGVRWFRSRPGQQERSINGAGGADLPLTHDQLASEEMLIAHFYSGDPRTIRVYIRVLSDKAEVVGVERTWGTGKDEPSSSVAAVSRKP